MKWTFLAIGIAFILDLLFGDPYFLPHPVTAIGKLISGLEKGIRKIFPKTKGGEILGGFVMVLLVLLISTGIPVLILWAAGLVNIWLRVAIETFMCYQILAAHSLKKESMKVYKEAKKHDLEGARRAVSMIVGRDTETLTDEGVIRAAVETVAENTSDGVIAPLFYMSFGGAALGFFYKAVNTMDSMVAYKNDKYLYFGRAAAILDDICNYIPARLSAFYMLFASLFMKLDSGNAWTIFWRDRAKHASPNSAQTESVCAGALQVQLAGDAWYFGKLHKKQTIGDPIRPIEPKDIVRANRLMYAASLVGTIAAMAVSFILYRVLFV